MCVCVCVITTNLVLDVPRLFEDAADQRAAQLQLDVGVEPVGRRQVGPQECHAALRRRLTHVPYKQHTQPPGAFNTE